MAAPATVALAKFERRFASISADRDVTWDAAGVQGYLAADAISSVMGQSYDLYPPTTLQGMHTSLINMWQLQERAVDDLAAALRAPSGSLPEQAAERAKVEAELNKFRTGLIAWSKRNYTTVPAWVLANNPPLG